MIDPANLHCSHPSPVIGADCESLLTFYDSPQGMGSTCARWRYDLVAAELGVSYETIVNTSYQLRSKLGIRNLRELIFKAIELLPRRT
jgi:hypothetical protein